MNDLRFSFHLNHSISQFLSIITLLAAVWIATATNPDSVMAASPDETAQKIITGGFTRENVGEMTVLLVAGIIALALVMIIKRVFGYMMFLISGPKDGDWWVDSSPTGAAVWKKVIRAGFVGRIQLEYYVDGIRVIENVPISQFPDLIYREAQIEKGEFDEVLKAKQQGQIAAHPQA
mgnify:CR=1 FL=1